MKAATMRLLLSLVSLVVTITAPCPGGGLVDCMMICEPIATVGGDLFRNCAERCGENCESSMSARRRLEEEGDELTPDSRKQCLVTQVVDLNDRVVAIEDLNDRVIAIESALGDGRLDTIDENMTSVSDKIAELSASCEAGECGSSSVWYGECAEETIDPPEYARFQPSSMYDHPDCDSSQIQGNPAGWCSTHNKIGEDWVTIDLGAERTLVGFTTAGRANTSQFVTEYMLYYGQGDKDDVNKQIDSDRVFVGNSDQTTEVTRYLNKRVTARYVRYVPQKFTGHMSFRVAAVVCAKPKRVCTEETIDPDESKRTQAADMYDHPDCDSSQIAGNPAGWCSTHNKIGEDWVVLDLGHQRNLVGFSTGGRKNTGQFVTKYKLEYGPSTDQMSPVDNGRVFDGNTENVNIITRYLNAEVNARYVKYIPQEFTGHMSFRVAAVVCG